MNTSPTWIVENFSNGDDVKQLVNAIRELQYPLIYMDRKTGFEYQNINIENQKVIFMGSINMACLVKKHLSTCSPVIFGEDEDFLCSSYYPNHLKYLFNDKHQFLTLKELKETKWDIYAKFGKEALIFIRPDSGDKTFTGQLLDLQDFDKFGEDNVRYNVSDDTIVVVSTPKNIIGEWRFIVSREKIISYSLYVYQKQRTHVYGAPRQAIDLVNDIIKNGKLPADICAVDIAQDSDLNCWLLEFNSFNSCGLYASKKHDIVKEVSNLVCQYQT